LPYLKGDRAIHTSTFGLFYATWNVLPEDRPEEISTETRSRLEAHFRADAGGLAELGVSAPWIARWDGR
jgi:hypothetical protein